MREKFKKEWGGESGYCNCLLVAMSRVPIPNLELRTDRDLPDLELLSKLRPETDEWIRTQELNISSLDAHRVIDILVESASMGRWPWSKKTGTISAVDCVGNDGRTIERVFALRLSKSKSVVCLHIEQKMT